MEKTGKITKRDHFEAIIALLNKMADAGTATDTDIDAEIMFCEKELNMLNRRSARSKENAEKRKAEPDEIYDLVAEVISDEFASIQELTNAIGREDVSKGKVANRLAKMVKAGIAEKGEVTEPDLLGKNRKVSAYRLIG